MIADLVRECYATYETKDRQGLEKLIADDFSFSSPQDDHIDRLTYFERCWHNSEKIRTITIEKLFERDGEAFVRYRSELKNGAVFRNTELLTFKDGKLVEVDVYFGRMLKEALSDDTKPG
jgi:ketosteroid isomerase-like protein